MAEENTAEPSTDVGADQTEETPPQINKATMKEELLDLLGEIPAFHELMNLGMSCHISHARPSGQGLMTPAASLAAIPHVEGDHSDGPPAPELSPRTHQ